MIFRFAIHIGSLWAAWSVLHTVARGSEAGILPALALAACGALFLRDRAPGAPDRTWSAVSTACLAAYGLSMLFLPRLVALTFALASLGAFLAAHTRAPRRSAGLVAVALAAAPLSDVLQAVSGTPLRLAVARVSAGFLSCAGITVQASGVALQDGARTFFVDPACSGLRYAWCAVLLAAVLAAWARLDLARTAFVLACAWPAAFVANVLRTSALYLLERSTIESARSAWVHTGVGAVGFALAALLLVYLAGRAQRRLA